MNSLVLGLLLPLFGSWSFCNAGYVDYSALTTSYASAVTVNGATKLVCVLNGTDADVAVSFNSGASNYDDASVILAGSDICLPTGAPGGTSTDTHALYIKRIGTASSGKVAINCPE